MKKFYAFTNAEAETAELAIYDVIGLWGILAADFRDQLKGLKGKKLDLRLNSPGGDVFAGYAIYNLLKASGKKITVYVDGLAASIASVIAMAGDKIVMPENSMLMIHDPSSMYASGTADDLRKEANVLDQVKEGILSIYEARTGSDRAKITALMKDTTYFTAKEAKDAGFADEVIPEKKVENRYNPVDVLSPEALKRFNEVVMRTNFQPGTPSGGQTQTKDTDTAMSKELTDRIAALEAENKKLTDAQASSSTAVQAARTDATNAAIAAEKKRKEDIKAHASKYNKNGILDAALNEALAGDMTVDAFKDKVTDLLAEAPTKPAIKPGAAGADGKITDEEFVTRFKACKGFAERKALRTEFPDQARRLAK